MRARSKRLAVAAGCIRAALLVGCGGSKFDAVTDASVRSDSGADGSAVTSFCEALTTSVFCSDFTNTTSPYGWTQVSTSGGGNASASPAVFTSNSFPLVGTGLQVVANPSSTVTGYLSKTLLAAPTRTVDFLFFTNVISLSTTVTVACINLYSTYSSTVPESSISVVFMPGANPSINVAIAQGGNCVASGTPSPPTGTSSYASNAIQLNKWAAWVLHVDTSALTASLSQTQSSGTTLQSVVPSYAFTKPPAAVNTVSAFLGVLASTAPSAGTTGSISIDVTNAAVFNDVSSVQGAGK